MGGLGSKGAELPAPDSGPGARGWQGLGAFFVMLVAMLERVISGFQTGADIAGIYAARAHGIPTGGAMPRGFLTEDGPRPDYAELYGAVELPTPSYPERTRRNVADGDGTLWFGDWHSPGGKATLDACRLRGKPFLIV
jgi:hypothetical protein